MGRSEVGCMAEVEELGKEDSIMRLEYKEVAEQRLAKQSQVNTN